MLNIKQNTENVEMIKTKILYNIQLDISFFVKKLFTDKK